MSIQNSIFAVDEVAYCVWDWDIKALNLEFLNSVNYKYFDYLANTHVEFSKEEDKHFAATALRLAYFHGLETLFALLCATLQAPNCVVAWIQKYKPVQLRNMVTAISKGKASFPVKLKLSPITWEEISKTINLFSFTDENRIIETKILFGQLWTQLASDFIDDYSVWEYNSIKHGFRTTPGGFTVEVGIEENYGVPAPPEKMEVLGSNEFGNSFFRAEQIINSADDPNIRIARVNVAWNPEAIAYSLLLISNSISNIISYLKIINGVDPSSVSFTRPVESAIFEKPQADPPSLSRFTMNYQITEESIVKLSRKQLKAEMIRQLNK